MGIILESLNKSGRKVLMVLDKSVCMPEVECVHLEAIMYAG